MGFTLKKATWQVRVMQSYAMTATKLIPSGQSNRNCRAFRPRDFTMSVTLAGPQKCLPLPATSQSASPSGVRA